MGFNKSWQSDEIKSASHGLQLLQLLNYSAYLSALALSSPALSYITIAVTLLDSSSSDPIAEVWVVVLIDTQRDA